MKKHLLLNQSFGTEGSPNQTGETLAPSDERAMTERRPSDEQRSRIPLLYPCYTFARAWKYVACMLMLLVLSIGQMWGAIRTIGMTNELVTSSKGGGAETYFGAHDSVTITEMHGMATADTLTLYTKGDQALYSGSSTAYYTQDAYRWNKSYSSFKNNLYIGYKVKVASGYKMSLSALNAQIYASDNFTWKVSILDKDLEELYTSGSKTATGFNNTKNSNLSISADLSSTTKVQNLVDSFYVRVYIYRSSTNKYLCVTPLTITGDIVATGGGDVTAPTLSSSIPANAATNVATSGNITLTFSENVTINDPSKFSLTGGAGTLSTGSASASGAVVTIPYSGLANNTPYTLATAEGAVKDASNNTSAELSSITFTTVKASHTVTAESNNDSYGTVSAGSSSVAEGSTTTITATPATGYQVTNWAVSGTGASISPDGASNSNTTTLTMGTANATVTATFGPKSYTVTLNNQSATSAGMGSVTTTYNSSSNLTSAITKPTKTGYVFAGYFTATNGGGVQLIDAAGNWIANAGGGSTYLDGSKNWKYDNNLALYACWMEYASTFDIEAYVQANVTEGSPNQTFTILGTNKLLYNLAGNTALDNSSTDTYDGLKFKNANNYVLFLVEANNQLQVTFGYISSQCNYSINGGAESSFSATTGTPVDLGTETYDRLVKIRSVDGNSTVLKKIQIGSSCTAPTGLTNGDTGSTSQEISWTAPASAPEDGYLVAYSSATNTDPGTDVTETGGNYTVVAAAGTSTTLYSLSASTTYHWWVRSVCDEDAGTRSAWVAGTDFNTSSCARQFATGDKIYFKDASTGMSALGNKLWKELGKNLYAYFWNGDDPGTWTVCTVNVDKDWNNADAIYEITVPEGGPYEKMFFSRGTEDGVNKKEKYTTDEQPCVGRNLFYISSDRYGDAFRGSWGSFTPSGKTIYFDNRNVTDWTTAYVRIGNSSSNSAWGSMTKVGGTRNLYSQASSQWASHTLFSIANKAGWTGDRDVDQPEVTYTDPYWSGDANKMTKQTNYQDYAIENDIYILPTSTSVLQHECQFYKVNTSTSTSRFDSNNTAEELPAYTVTTSETHCTVTMVKYTADDFSTNESLASGGTVKPTQYIGVTVTPDAGYTFSSVSLSSGKYIEHTAAADGVTGKYAIMDDACVVTAVCTEATYNITYKDGGNVDFSGSHADGYPTSHTYGTATTLKGATKDGYTFDGWYTSSNCGSSSKVTSLAAGDYTADITLYAQWKKEVYLKVAEGWANDNAWFAVYYYGGGADAGWAEMELADECSSPRVYKASIPALVYDHLIFTRMDPSKDVLSFDSKWNQTEDISYPTTQWMLTITSMSGGADSKSQGSWGTYSVPTFAISYATGSTTATGGAAISGSKASESKTCGEDFTLPSSAVFTATGYTQVGWTTSDGGTQTHALGGAYTTDAAQTFYPVWEADDDDELTALVSGTLYKVPDMIPSGASLTSSDQFLAGLSANTKFELIGDASESETPKVNNNTSDNRTINSIDFNTGAMFFKGVADLTSNIPTKFGLSFIVPSAGTLKLYFNNTGTSTTIKIAKSGATGTSPTLTDGHAEVDVTAGTYYLYGTATSGEYRFYGLQFDASVPCTAAPTVTAGANSSVGSTTATVTCAGGISSLGTGGCTITSYGFVIGTVTGPTIGGSGVTQHEVGTSYASTGTSFSKDLTGLTAETTYYVRPYATNGSGTAYGTETSFTTTAAGEDPIPALISYYLQTPDKKTTPASLSTDSIITTPARLKGDTLKNFVPMTLGSSLDITKAGKGDGGTWSAGIGTTPTDSATAVTDAYAAKLAFDVHDDYELNISSITLKVLSVTNGSQIYRVKVSDGEHTVYGRVAPGKDTESSVVFGSFSGIKFSGTVTLTLWVWSTAAAEYRLKSPIQIDGTLTRKATACTMPTQTFSTGAYTLGDDALDLSTLFSSNSSGAVTYSVVNAGGTSATIVGSSFTASNTGTATIRATQAADGVNNKCAKSIETTITVSGDCTPQSLVKTVMSSTKAGTTTGYNDGEYAGEPVIATFEDSPTNGGYKLKSGSKLFVTLKKGNFVAGDKINIVITQASDLTNTTGKLLIFYNASTPALLKTIDAASAGTYTYTLTDDDITTLGSTKTIGVFRSSGTTENNPYVKSVEVAGCRDWAVCTAPNAVVAGSVTHNSAVLTVTDEEETGNYEFYYSTSSTAPTASTVALATGSALTKTITGLSASTTYYYWVRSNCGGVTKSAWVAGTPATFATTAAPSTYSVTYSATDKTSGSVPTDASTYEEGDIVTVKGNTGSLVKTGQTFLGWSTNATASSGTFYPAGYKFYMGDDNVTLYAVWGSAAEEKYYYGQVGITDGALVKGAANTLMFFTNEGGVIASSTALTMTTSNLGTGPSCYYNSNDLTHTGLNKSSNWGTSSGSNKYIRGLKWANGKSYTLGLGTKAATSIMFYGWAGAADNTLTIGGVEYTSTGTSFFSNDFTKVGNFTGNVTIACGGDFYGILVITISTGAASGHTVSFDMNGHGSAIADIENVPSGSKIGAPVPAPTAADYDFLGWYREAGGTNAWDFGTMTITKDTTLYAKWGNCAPTITTHPVAANYNQNGVASALTVVAATNGGGDLHYQWWVKENDLADEDGSAIPGETGTSFTPSTELLGTSYYYCVVSNDCGNVKTNTAAVTVRDAKPAPTAVWDVEEPTHGGKGFSFSVVVKQNDEETLWDGTLTADMLSVSSEAVLGTVTVNDGTKTISGTYGVKGSATSPVTFYLLLPATDTQAAARLDYDKTFTTCTGGGDGSTYRVPVRKDSEKDASNNYRWVTAGAGEISYTYGSTISSGKATSSYNSFDSIVSSDKQNLYVRTYNANIKKVTLYVLTGGKDITVESIYKQTSYKGADDKDKLSTAAYSVTYDDGSDENTGAKGNHYIVITLEDPLEANDILMFKFSKSNVKAYGAVFTQTADGGTEIPTLGWSPSIDGNVEKNENAADFTYTATRSNDEAVASLGIISYSSSNTTVATVNATTGQVMIADDIDFGSADHIDVTITATLSASGCYKKATTTYTLRVKKYVCSEAAGTIAVKSDDGCSKVLEITGYEAEATIQWYKDGVAIDGEIGTTYTAASGGTYYAITHKTCDAVSNELTISTAAATATKIVDEWYVKNDRRTPDIALVQTTNATGFTVTNKSGGATVSDIGGCTFELKEDGIIYLHGTQVNGDAPSDMTDGDITLVITATACVNASPVEITIHRQEQRADGKPSVAFVVDGTLRKDGGTATSVLEAKTSDRPLWKYLENTFALTGCNAYWSVDSKELRQYYSQFDAILITDDPSTDTKGTGGVSYVKAFGTMVDVRPVLTMEAYVGKFKDGGWHVYDATPSSPNPRQVELKLECKNHDIFKGLDPETSDNVRVTRDEYNNEYWHVIMVDTTQSPYHNTKSDYEALPALQGFDKTKFSNMLGVGTIFEEKLQAGVERQEEPAARMMILGIQNNAMAALTNEGKLVIKNALEYLLKTNMEDVNDCANYFTGGPDGTGDNWATPENWSSGKVPDFESRVRILRPVVISGGTKAIVARVDIATKGKSKWIDGECNGKVTVNSQGALIVSGKIRRAEAPDFGIDNLQPTENDDLIVRASSDGTHYQGALIHDNTDGLTHAEVEMWNPSHWEVEGGKKKKYWSYVAVPIQEADIPNFFWHGFTYLYDETSGWEKKFDGSSLYPFQGIGASLQTGNIEWFYGPLATTESQDITLTYTADKGQGMNLIGNSWTAPIQIANFEEDDFGDAAAEVWVFNTGHENEGSGSGSSTTAGQWNAIPINSAGLPGYEGLKVIPAMQAFEVNTTVETTLHLDYDRLVRAGRENLNEPMRAPRRSAAKEIEATMRVRVSGELTHTDVYLLKDARFSDGFDNGWDGHYLSGDDRSAQLYAISEEEGKLAFLAQPEIEGTVLGFAPSKHGNEYTFSFSYDGDEEYYLNDLKLTSSTLISDESSYLFTYEEGDTNRFYISRQPLGAPAVATGVDEVREEAKPRKFIYNDKMYILFNGRVFDATGKAVK